jgi:hypothetical protein
MLEVIVGAIVGAISTGLISYFLPKIIKHFRRPLIFAYEYFPIRIASLFHHKIDVAEKSINILHDNLKQHIFNNLKELQGLEKIHDSLNEFIRNLKWLFLSDIVMKIILLNRGDSDLKEISISFTFLSQLTGYEIKWAENHEVEEPPKIFRRDKVNSIKVIKTLKPKRPIKIFVWGVVLEELKEKYTKEDFSKVLNEQLFIGYSGNNKGLKKKKIKT